MKTPDLALALARFSDAALTAPSLAQFSDAALTAPSLARFSDAALTAHIGELVAREHELIAEQIVALAELARRRLHLELGASSLFVYLSTHLGLPPSSAYRRSTAVRLSERFPAIIGLLRTGQVSLNKLCFLKEALDEANHAALLAEAAKLTEKQVEALAVALRPRKILRDAILPLPPPRAIEIPTLIFASATEMTLTTEVTSVTEVASTAETTSVTEVTSTMETTSVTEVALATETTSITEVTSTAETTSVTEVPAPSLLPTPRVLFLSLEQPDTVKSVTQERSMVRMTVGPQFLQQLREVQAALSHTIPAGGLEDILSECMRVTLEVCHKRRHGEGTAPRNPGKSLVQKESNARESNVRKESNARKETTGRYVPMKVRREVWARDGGRCTFVGATGQRCEERQRLEFHHRLSHALGGPATVENMTLYCRAHNDLAARRELGDAHMDLYAKSRIAPSAVSSK